MPGTFRDSLYLLAVVLEQETELQPTEIMTDTAGYTDTIFGIFHLLGLQFGPRIADISGARFWRVDRKADYGILDELASNRINIKLVIEHWDDLLRLAGSLKLGVVRAAGLTRVLFSAPLLLRPLFRQRWHPFQLSLPLVHDEDSARRCARRHRVPYNPNRNAWLRLHGRNNTAATGCDGRHRAARYLYSISAVRWPRRRLRWYSSTPAASANLAAVSRPARSHAARPRPILPTPMPPPSRSASRATCAG